ncbi:MAG: peptidase E [Flaviramulus sp.]|nr:DUF6702 family protein [Flaviramulus sp.]NNC49771.1 peptidase E [Flaviramulus sp.]
MKVSKLLVLLIILPLLAFTSLHKYYVSVTQINYIGEKQSLQITSRIFIDDFENVLRKKYDDKITLSGENIPEAADAFIKKYLKEKIIIKVNKKIKNIAFIGKEYEGDIMRCYLEIEGLKNIKSIEISNQVLFELFKDQQNIVKTKIYPEQKSAILTVKNKFVVLNFN